MCDKYFSHFVSACPRTRLVDQIRLVVWNIESCIQPHNPLKTTHPYTGAPLPSSLNPQPPFSLTVRRYIPTSTPTPQTPPCFQLHMRASKRVPHLGLHTESTGILSPISPAPLLHCPVRPLRRPFPFTALYRGHRCGQPCKFLTSNAWPRLLSTKNKPADVQLLMSHHAGKQAPRRAHPKLSPCTGIFIRVWANTCAHESQTSPFPCTGIFPAPRQTP